MGLLIQYQVVSPKKVAFYQLNMTQQDAIRLGTIPNIKAGGGNTVGGKGPMSRGGLLFSEGKWGAVNLGGWGRGMGRT